MFHGCSIFFLSSKILTLIWISYYHPHVTVKEQLVLVRCSCGFPKAAWGLTDSQDTLPLRLRVDSRRDQLMAETRGPGPTPKAITTEALLVHVLKPHSKLEFLTAFTDCVRMGKESCGQVSLACLISFKVIFFFFSIKRYTYAGNDFRTLLLEVCRGGTPAKKKCFKSVQI